MKQFLAVFAQFVVAGLFAAHQVEPEKPKATNAPVENATPAIRFNTTATAIAGMSGDTMAIAASADGKRVASVGGTFNPGSGFVRVIETQSKKEIISLRFSRPFNSVGISPDGKNVAFTSQTGDMTVMEVDTGKTLFSKKLGNNAQLTFAQDGQSLATVTQTKNVQIWEVPSGEEQTKLRGATVPLRCVALSADGRNLAAGGGEQQKKNDGNANGIVFVWDIATQRLAHKLETSEPAQVLSIAFSPDGKLVAGACNDGQIRVWELTNEKVKTTLMTQQQVFGLAFSPGRTIAGAMGDGTIRLWNADSGEELGVLSRHVGLCRCVAFADEGKKLVSGGNAQSLKLWDVQGKKELATLRQDEGTEDLPVPLSLAATRDGLLVASTTEDKGIILRDGQSGEVKATLKGHEDAVTCVAFSPNGKTLATGSVDKTIKLWDVATGKDRMTLKGHTNWVYALAFSNDGKTLASGAYDKTVRIWDVDTGKEKGSIDAHKGSVRAVAFSPDDKSIASGGSDRLVKLWNVADRELKFAMKGHQGAVRSLAFSSNGSVLASGGEDGFVRFWNPSTGKQFAATKKEHNEEVSAIAFAGERLLLSGGSDGTLMQWDATTGAMVGALQGHNGGVSGIAVAAGGTEFLSTGADRILKRFQQGAAGPIRLFSGHTGVVNCVSFSPDGQRFVSCGNWPEGDKTLRVWDVQKGMEVLKIALPAQAGMALFSPDGKSIASVSGNTNVYLWNATTGEQIRIFKGHTAGIGGLAFNADGSRILTSCGGDKTVRLWDTATGRELQKFTGHTGSLIRRVAFHPDGKHALSAGRDGLVRMWELETAKEVKQFKASGIWADCLAVSKDGKFLAIGGQTSVLFEIESGKMLLEFHGATELSFSADGKRILTSSFDGTARLWERETGKELYTFRAHREMLWSAVFSPDGKWVLTGGGGVNMGDGNYNKGTDHAVRLWKMPDENAIIKFTQDN